jgi:hypothetical protein
VTNLKQIVSTLLPELQLISIMRRRHAVIEGPQLSPVVVERLGRATDGAAAAPAFREAQLSRQPIPASDPETAWREAIGELALLRGHSLREFEAELEQMKAQAAEGIAAAGSGYVFLFSGDAGTGKSALAAILPRLLFGARLLDSDLVVDLLRQDPADGESGVWIADNADDLLEEPARLTQLGRTFLKTNERRPLAVMVLIGGPGFAERLARAPQASLWLIKCEIHDFHLPALSDGELLLVADDLAADMGFALEGAAKDKLGKIIAHLRGDTGENRPGAPRFDGVGTVIQLLTQAKKAAGRQKRRVMAAADFT